MQIRQLSVGVILVLSVVLLSSHTVLSVSGGNTVFLPLVLAKPADIPTYPILAIFTTKTEAGNYTNTLYATTPNGTITPISRNTGDDYKFW